MWIDASRYLESLKIAELPSQKACIISQTIGWEPLCDAQIEFLSWYLHYRCLSMMFMTMLSP